MPRNEEEVVKNIVTLSKQLRFIHDIPQVIISFDQQTVSQLSFTVVFLRILKSRDPSLKDIFEHFKTKFQFILDRVKKVGVIRRKYFKEANVFRVILKDNEYLRVDHSIDINKARQDILKELNRIFGEIRDYNGGMIYKQNEVYEKLKYELHDQNKLLLEKFFYSITPQEMTAIVPISYLKELFLMLLSSHEKKKMTWSLKQEIKAVHLIVPLIKEKQDIEKALDKVVLFSGEFFSFNIKINDRSYLGYSFLCEDKVSQKNLILNLQQALDF